MSRTRRNPLIAAGSWPLAALTVVMTLTPLGSPPAEAEILRPWVVQEKNREYEVKAAFLKNFIAFVDWPESVLARDSKKILVGIVGADPFGEHQAILDGKAVKSRTVEVRFFKDASGVADCHMVFIPRTSSGHTRAVLTAVKGRPVVTVGEEDEFIDRGGTINFAIQGAKIRFEVNHAEARVCDLKLSSKLLDLAIRVIPAPKS